MMDKEDSCMLKEITDFLIRVGEHCMECEGKSVEPQKPIMKELDTIIFKSKPKIEAGVVYLVPTDITPQKQHIIAPVELSKTINSQKFKNKQKTYKRHIKLSYLEKWIQNGVFEIFTLEQFLKAFPKQKENKNLDDIILRLLKTKKIAQLDKNKYMVVQ